MVSDIEKILPISVKKSKSKPKQKVLLFAVIGALLILVTGFLVKEIKPVDKPISKTTQNSLSSTPTVQQPKGPLLAVWGKITKIDTSAKTDVFPSANGGGATSEARVFVRADSGTDYEINVTDTTQVNRYTTDKVVKTGEVTPENSAWQTLKVGERVYFLANDDLKAKTRLDINELNLIEVFSQ